jgi:hypothetical protein
VEDWIFGVTLSGAPQGGVASLILSNIYLHRLDAFVETVLIPDYTRGVLRARNLAYRRVADALARARKGGDRAKARELRKRLRGMPSQDPCDPGYRRLRYVRYADDHLLGFVGPKAEAEEIKQRLAAFLREELKLELSQDKTLITHARTRAAKFLGYEVTVRHADNAIRGDRRAVNSTIGLRVPTSVIKAKCAPYVQRGQPARRSHLIDLDDYNIVRIYGSEYRGIVQYYLLADDVWRLSRLRWVAETSMLKTLAAKYDSSVSRMAARHRAKIETPHKLRTCFEARVERDGRQPLVARFGGIPLKRHRGAVITDRVPGRITYPRKELVTRLLRRSCEVCEQTGLMQVHQVRKLADLTQPGPAQPPWEVLMARKRRKTLVVCPPCHEHIHSGQPPTAVTA